MSNTSQGPGWWLASDGRWYPPELWTGPPSSRPAGAPSQPAGASQAQPIPTYPPHLPGQNPSGYPAQYPAHYPGYGQYPYGQPIRQKTNGLAIASLICSCVGLFLLPAIVGIVFGFVAQAQIRRANGLQKGRGLALAGILVGFGWLALLLLSILLGNHSANNGTGGMVGGGFLWGS
jgi:Domain of unknown function (DUF4190)